VLGLPPINEMMGNRWID